MQVIHPRCAALDLGKDIQVAGVRLQEADGSVRRECRTYGTTRVQIEALKKWLSGLQVTHVVMEATGSYWKAIWRELEHDFTLTLANPAHIKNVPGRKSDVNDATWMSDLHAHGLIRGSFVPSPDVVALRELTRTRKQLVRELGRHELRIQRILDVADIKITGLISDVLGVSGRKILKALIAGETDAAKLAALAHSRIQVDQATLAEALGGRLSRQQRRLLKMHLRMVEQIQKSIDELDVDIQKAVTPFRPAIARLSEIPGFSPAISIPALLGEIGVDLKTFPDHRHLLSWARLCPRLDESAGKIRSRRTLKGSVWLKTLMVQAAWCAMKSRDSYFRAQYFRIRARRGPKKAIVAVAASLLTVIFYVLKEGRNYSDLGAHYFDQLDTGSATRRYVKRLEQLGFSVTLRPTA